MLLGPSTEMPCARELGSGGSAIGERPCRPARARRPGVSATSASAVLPFRRLAAAVEVGPLIPRHESVANGHDLRGVAGGADEVHDDVREVLADGSGGLVLVGVVA